MNRFFQHIPAFYDGFEPEVFDFLNTAQLLSHSLIHRWTTNKDFHRLSIAHDLIMVETKKGESWWVLGRVLDPKSVDLPVWKPKKKKTKE